MTNIKIRTESCKSCLYCVKFCRKDVLAVGKEVNSKGYPYIIVKNLQNCVECLSCAVMCPEAAIEINVKDGE